MWYPGRQVTRPEFDFTEIRGVGLGGPREGFEEFVCQIARHDTDAPVGAKFERYRGAGGDGGVECVWLLPDGSEWGWQAKFLFELDKAQLDRSVTTALGVHPRLVRYTIALPFDPTGRTTRRGQSDTEKIAAWRSGWEAQAATRGLTVEFQVVWRSELIDRLLNIDRYGVRTHYWFDKQTLTESWWQARLRAAIEASRPRYTPKLRVDVPVMEGFDAFTTSPKWHHRVEKLLDDVDLAVGHLERPPKPAGGTPPPDLSGSVQQARALRDALASWKTDPSEARRDEARRLLGGTRQAAHDTERSAADALEARHGPGVADSVAFRQWMSEYQVSFPAATLDAIRELLRVLDDVDAVIGGTGRLAGARTAVLIGAAGVGKTFAVCDIATDRLSGGLPSIVLHGRWFSGGDPLSCLRMLLDLPADLTVDQTLALLDVAGQTAGAATLLIIDALNETVPRSTWRDHLDRLVAATSAFDHLRLLVTVRTPYVSDVIPDGLDLPSFEHHGFEGVEFDALVEYARHYGLEPPAVPPMQSEYANPMFLRLLCEALEGSGRAALIDSSRGIGEVVELLLDNKNRRVSAQLNAPETDRLVPMAVRTLTEEMAQAGRPWLHRANAQRTLRRIWPGYTSGDSLLEALIGEGLLGEDRVIDPDTGGTVDIVAVAFERLAQHLIVTARLDTVDDIATLKAALDCGSLRALLHGQGTPDLGILEALATEVPRRYGVELESVTAGDMDVALVRAATVNGLPWRHSTTITEETVSAVRAALRDHRSCADTLEVLFSLASRADHPLNADWTHRFLESQPMASRDAVMIPWLFEGRGTRGAFDRLVRWARHADLEPVSHETARVWTTILLWCTGCSDRRVRDAAIYGAARLLARHPLLVAPLIDRFAAVDDDWIIEGTLAATYGALLCCDDAEAAWHAAATIVWKAFFADAHPPANALIRDHARNILEAAAYHGRLPIGADPHRFRPPFASPWPVVWPEEPSLAPYTNSARYPKLVSSCVDDDFAIYQVKWMLGHRLGVDPLSAGRWIVHEVVALGYTPERFADFDRTILGRFGPGRAKPAWIERVGKKYQWIALARLAGIVADHTEPERSSWEPPPGPIPPLQAERLRHLDPSILVPADDADDGEPPEVSGQPEYQWQASQHLDDTAWVHLDDIPGLALLVDGSRTADGRSRIVVDGSYEWWQPVASRGRYPQRHIWMFLHGLFVFRRDTSELLAWLEGRDLDMQDTPRGFDLHEGYVGEYPFGVVFQEAFHQIKQQPSHLGMLPVTVWPAAHYLLGEYEYEGTGATTVSLFVPSERLFEDASQAPRWDGRGSWRTRDVAVATNASLFHRRGALTLDRAWLEAWLGAHDLDLVWVEVSGKDAYQGFSEASPGRLIRSRPLRFSAGDVVASTPLLVRQPPTGKGGI